MSGNVPVKAQISGIVRGILQEGVLVTKGMKAGDIDAGVNGITVLPYQIKPELSAAACWKPSVAGSMEYRRKRCIPYKAMKK